MYAMKNVYHKFFIFVYLLLQGTKLAVAVRKYVHQRDVSEHCKRRVLPSLFLGRRVLDVNSHILHFSKLELPYSCSISVRAESGSNIILVIQFVEDYSLLSSCTEHHHQLLVYEIGETFGGYWGALPDSIMHQEVNNFTKYYTLKATQPSTISYDYGSENERDAEPEATSVLKLTQNANTATEGEYIRMEVPLVNVSGNFLLDGLRPRQFDSVLDAMNDVTPREGVDYDTSILPLVQFSMLTPKSIDHSDFTTSDYNREIYTTDYRLVLRTINQRKKFRNKNRSFVNRRLNFKKRLSTLIPKSKSTSFRNNYFYRPISTKSNNLLDPRALQKNGSLFAFSDFTIGYVSEPRKVIDRILTSLNHTTLARKPQIIPSQKILDSQYNLSVYLLPNISLNNYNSPTTNTNKKVFSMDLNNLKTDVMIMTSPVHSVTFTESTKDPSLLKTYKYTMNDTETSSFSDSFASNNVHFEKDKNNTLQTFTNHTSAFNLDLHNLKINESINLRKEIPNNYKNSTTNVIKNTELITGSMVNHESWENVVQAAPVMAVLLNRSLPQIDDTTASNHSNNTIRAEKGGKNGLVRKKRYIQPIDLEIARPRFFTTTRDSFFTTKNVEDFVDMQDISNLVELKDDEIQGRIALRYMRNYVGSTLFNICDYREPKTRHVYLFNTSRIVIAISNFTMEQMSLVMTPARTLRATETNCPVAHLECQISGARVCIDSMSACDGVPNCGSYDIYDEDRKKCGEVTVLQHNVYLAACTFMAVLLILLYTVHYWIKRCVPRVSEAFFIYTDRSENILNLDTIMRNPNDDDDESKMVFSGHTFDDDILDVDIRGKAKQNYFKKIWKLVLGTCSKSKLNVNETDEEGTKHGLTSLQPQRKRLYSFAELELSKIVPIRTVDAHVQTGDSLEQTDQNKIKHRIAEEEKFFNSNVNLKFKKAKDTIKQKHASELNVLKFMKESRSNSTQFEPINHSSKPKENVNKNLQYNLDINNEKELLSTVYEPQASHSRKQDSAKVVGSCDVHSERSEPSVQKRLRFDEEATTIPSAYTEDEIVEGHDNWGRSHVVFGTEKLRYSGATQQLEEKGSGSGREFIRFWSGVKDKKSKRRSM